MNLRNRLNLQSPVVFLCVVCFLIPPPGAKGQVSGAAFTHSYFLDKQGKYFLEWSVNWVAKEVTFNVTVNTKGYVGLGLSRKGKMSGADIVIGGVTPEGEPYFSDRHAVFNQLPVEDLSQDWILNVARENGSHTYLSFTRPFDTCDEHHNLPIGSDVTALIWAYGEHDDEIQYHFQNRGVFQTYLLDPDLTPQQVHDATRENKRLDRLGNLKLWTISISEQVSSRDTSYLCTVHKAPSLSKKHHMVGFRKVFPTEADRRHVHHSTLHHCRLPAGQNMTAFFAPYLNRPAESCNIFSYTNRVPSQFCAEIVHQYSYGAAPMFLPPHVGIPLSESPEEYYMYQIHYDNSMRSSNLTVNTHLEVYYTNQLRQHDAGVMFIGVNNPGAPSIVIPSNSIDHVIYGHCGGGCTRTMFPPEGVQVFAGKHHTHSTGAADRFLHIRNSRELPYLLNDDNFMFDFQPVRLLRHERTVLPNDVIIKRCLYTSTNRNGTATVGGLSVREEMCSGFFWYYPLVRTGIYSTCVSEIRSEEYDEFLGITNTTWSEEIYTKVVTGPPEKAGLTVEQVGTNIDWTIEKRRQLRHLHRSLPQVTFCADGSPELVVAPGSSTPAGELEHVPPSSSITGFYTSAKPNVFPSVYSNTVIPYKPPNSCRQRFKKE